MRWRWCAAGGQLTYAGLVARAGRLAGCWRGRARARRRWWGCACRAGADMVAAVLAVWWRGAAYLPLDPGYPAARLGFMLADSRAAVLVAGTGGGPGGRGLAGCGRCAVVVAG